MPKAKKGASSSSAYKTAVKKLGPKPNKWALSSLRKQRAHDFVEGSACYATLMNSAMALESEAEAEGIPKPN